MNKLLVVSFFFLCFFNVGYSQELELYDFKSSEYDQDWELSTRGAKLTGVDLSKDTLIFYFDIAFGTCRKLIDPIVSVKNDTMALKISSRGGDCWGGKELLYIKHYSR